MLQVDAENAIKPKKLISVIVPVYNAGAFLSKCIKSILEQSYPYLDIILIDDGSTDNSLEICRAYEHQDKRIRVYHIPNGGVGNARNTGIKYAQGVFIQFVDSDDTIKPDMCKILLEEQQKNNADLVVCGFDNVDINQKHLFYECSEKKLDTVTAFFNNFGYLLERNLLRSPVNKLYKKEIIDLHGLHFSSDFNIAEDALFNLEYYRYIQTVTVLPQDLYTCLEHNNENRLTKKFHQDYFQAQNIFFTKLVELLKAKNLYISTNKKIIKKQYANIIYIGIKMFEKHTGEIDNRLIQKYSVSDIFLCPHPSALVAHAKKNMAVTYIKTKNTIGKKMYGLIKFCFWQCTEVYYIIKFCLNAE